MKHKSKIDIPVLLIFFNRYAKISEVFESVKKARPSRLYLYQDGARENCPDDIENVEKCRRVFDDIDWECEVFTYYQDKNFGCDPSEYIAQKWFFEKEEYGIVLEDDDVPSQSFFPYAKELLERYKDDDRVAIICGMNNNGVTKDVNESYFFSKHGSIWGWASWRRFIDLWDGEYTWLDNEEILGKVKEYFDTDPASDFNKYINLVKTHKDSGRAHYESIMSAAASRYNMLNIVPKYNMIKNIGIDNESTHSVADIRLLPRRTQKLLYKKTYEIDFPLIHPKTVELNIKFDKSQKVGTLSKTADKLESVFRRLIFGDFKGLLNAVKRRLHK